MNETGQQTDNFNALHSAVENLQRVVNCLSGIAAPESVSPPVPGPKIHAGDDPEADEATNQRLFSLAKREYAHRSQRQMLLDVDLLGEPAWDMLLDLFIADFEHRKVSVTSACIASRVPTSTALRWVRMLEQRGLFERVDDAADGRRSWIRLSATGRSHMRSLLAARLESESSSVFRFS